MPQLSLIVGVFNAEKTLPLLFDSIDRAGEQSTVSWEVVLVDNNSRDKSLAMMRDYAARAKVPTRILTEGRQGVSSARNTGMRAASGDILGIVDSDCVLSPDWPSALWREFERAPDLVMLGGRVELHNKNDLPISIRTSMQPAEVSVEAFNFLEIPGCNLAFRRSLMDAIGIYDPRLGPGTRVGMGEDVDYVYRAARRGPVRYAPDVVVYHAHGRSAPEQLQRVQWSYMVGKGAFFTKYILRTHPYFFKRGYWEVRALKRPDGDGGAADATSLPASRLLRAFFRGVYLQATDEIIGRFAR